jgi:LysM repeat protein
MRLPHWLLLCLLLVGAFAVIAPQRTEAKNTCPTLVQTALEQMGDNCTSLGRNSACYGFNRVNSTFFDEAPLDFFSKPSDQAGLAQLETITTAPLDLDSDEWGIAVMNVQANVPGALPGQSIVFMLMGDAEVTNAVPAEDTLPEVEPIDVTTNAETAVLTTPSSNANALTTVPAGTILQAVGVSGDWLKVYSEAGLGWVAGDAVEDNSDLGSLPAVTETMQAPMQAFQVSTAINDVLCNEAPSLLAIQSPENIKVDLMANGVHINMGSLILVRILPPGDVLQIMTIEGDVTLDPGTPFEVHLEPGFVTTRCMTADGIVGTDCGWTEPAPMTEAEVTFSQTALQGFEEFGDGSVRIIDTNACEAGTAVEYTVQPGDSLSLIGLQFGSNAAAIIENNNLDGTIIVVGQTLDVICGEQAQVIPVPVENQPVVQTGVDCTGFGATSPLDGLKYGENTFYWSAPNMSVSEYRVNVTGEGGSASFTTSGENLSLTGDLSINNIGYGFSFSWNVEVLSNGEPVCSTQPVVMFREAPPPPPRDREPRPEPTAVGTEEPCECS